MLLMSDLHLFNYPDFARPWKNGCNTRLRECLDALERAFQIGEHEGEDTYIIAGDIFHAPNVIQTPLGDIVYKFVFDLLKRYTVSRLIMIPGRHDMPDRNNPSSNTLSGFIGHPLIEVIEQCMFKPGMEVLFLPDYENPEFIREQLRIIRAKNFKTTARCLVTHMDVMGALPSIDDYIPPIKGIHPEELLGLPYIISGHFHMPQPIKAPSGDDLGVYLGSMLHRDKSDMGQEKRVLILRNDGTFKSVPLGGPKIEEITILERPFPDLRTDTWWRINCQREMVRDIREYYTDHLLKIIPIKPEERSTEFRLRVDQSEDPIKQYIRYKKPELDEVALEQVARYYLHQCC